MSNFRSLARASLLSTLALASCNDNSAGVAATAGTVPAIAPYAGIGGGLPSCLTKMCIYAYTGSDKNGKSQITTYVNDASGNIPPLGVLSGKHTKLVALAALPWAWTTRFTLTCACTICRGGRRLCRRGERRYGSECDHYRAEHRSDLRGSATSPSTTIATFT